MSNSIKRIEMIEWTSTFKSFLQRIWVHSYDEYRELFWDNILMRKVATERCIETYPNMLNQDVLKVLFNKHLEEWKD